jgi:hypothetical protein
MRLYINQITSIMTLKSTHDTTSKMEPSTGGGKREARAAEEGAAMMLITTF